jgi:ADP-ribose pyrophosphatase
MEINTIIDGISTLAAVVTLIFILRQLKQQTKQLKLEALTEIHREVRTKDFRKALGLVFNGDPRYQKKEIEDSIRLVSGLYDLLGVRVQEGVLPRDETLKTEWKILVFLWKRIQGFILLERKRRGLPYKEYLEWLVKEAEDYRKEHCSECEPNLSYCIDYIEECKKLASTVTGSKFQKPNLLYQGKYLHFYSVGNRWEYVSRSMATGGVNIVAVTPQNKIILVEQYRIPIRKNVIELPAGLVGDNADRKGENFEDAAKRELEEETGYSCKQLKFLCKGPMLPGLSDEINAFYLAEKLMKKVGHKRPGEESTNNLKEEKQENVEECEKITVHEVSLKTVFSWLDAQKNGGKVVDLRVYAGMFFLKGKHHKLLFPE